jgi:hypothetical protein
MSSWAVEQFGFAIRDGFERLLRISPLISGIIKGTSSSYLKFEDKSITKLP